jgi:hypothetical protein
MLLSNSSPLPKGKRLTEYFLYEHAETTLCYNSSPTLRFVFNPLPLPEVHQKWESVREEYNYNTASGENEVSQKKTKLIAGMCSIGHLGNIWNSYSLGFPDACHSLENWHPLKKARPKVSSSRRQISSPSVWDNLHTTPQTHLVHHIYL